MAEFVAEYEFDAVGEPDGLEPEVAATPVSPTSTEETLRKIRDMVADPQSNVSDINRLIALGIANTLVEQHTPSVNLATKSPDKHYTEVVKSFRELAKTIMESEELSKRDMLDMEGPKFQYIFAEILGMFQKVLKDSGTDLSVQQSIMRQFRDLVSSEEERLRRDLATKF